VNNCIFLNNAANLVGASNVGGAINNNSGTGVVTVNNSTFFNNKATGTVSPQGGAIFPAAHCR
jgi:hypothetical protein